jgi:hypothetical protein
MGYYVHRPELSCVYDTTVKMKTAVQVSSLVQYGFNDSVAREPLSYLII